MFGAGQQQGFVPPVIRPTSGPFATNAIPTGYNGGNRVLARVLDSQKTGVLALQFFNEGERNVLQTVPYDSAVAESGDRNAVVLALQQLHLDPQNWTAVWKKFTETTVDPDAKFYLAAADASMPNAYVLEKYTHGGTGLLCQASSLPDAGQDPNLFWLQPSYWSQTLPPYNALGPGDYVVFTIAGALTGNVTDYAAPNGAFANPAQCQVMQVANTLPAQYPNPCFTLDASTGKQMLISNATSKTAEWVPQETVGENIKSATVTLDANDILALYSASSGTIPANSILVDLNRPTAGATPVAEIVSLSATLQITGGTLKNGDDVGLYYYNSAGVWPVSGASSVAPFLVFNKESFYATTQDPFGREAVNFTAVSESSQMGVTGIVTWISPMDVGGATGIVVYNGTQAFLTDTGTPVIKLVINLMWRELNLS